MLRYHGFISCIDYPPGIDLLTQKHFSYYLLFSKETAPAVNEINDMAQFIDLQKRPYILH